MKIFGREPAVLLAALVAVATAVVLRDGALYAAILNAAQAGMALFVGFGLDWSADKQALVMASVGALLAVFGVRPQVQAPVAQVPLETKSPVDRAA
jgi:hypothetical protein